MNNALLSVGSLFRDLKTKVSLKEIGDWYFELFSCRVTDEMPNAGASASLQKLLQKAQQCGQLESLIAMIYKDRPDIFGVTTQANHTLNIKTSIINNHASTPAPTTSPAQTHALHFEDISKTLQRINNIFVLLKANHCIVPWVHRGSLTKDMHEWLDDGSAFSLCCISGRGGAGKTRLALEILQHAKEHSQPSWAGGFVRSVQPLDPTSLVSIASQQILLIYDYAEANAHTIAEHVEVFNQHLDQYPNTKVRILLLTRSIESDWWNEFYERCFELNVDITNCNLDSEYDLQNNEAIDLYKAAYAAYQQRLQGEKHLLKSFPILETTSDQIVVPSLEGLSPLSIAIFALLHLYAQNVQNTKQRGDNDLLVKVLHFEKERLQKYYNIDATKAKVVMQTMALVSLSKPIDLPHKTGAKYPKDLTKLVQVSKGCKDQDAFVKNILHIVAEAFRQETQKSSRLTVLEPDRLAECAIIEYLDTSFTEVAIDILENPKSYNRALTVLVRALQKGDPKKTIHITSWLETFFADKFTKERLEGVLKPAIEVASREMSWELAGVFLSILRQGPPVSKQFAAQVFDLAPNNSTILRSIRNYLAIAALPSAKDLETIGLPTNHDAMLEQFMGIAENYFQHSDVSSFAIFHITPEQTPQALETAKRLFHAAETHFQVRNTNATLHWLQLSALIISSLLPYNYALSLFYLPLIFDHIAAFLNQRKHKHSILHSKISLDIYRKLIKIDSSELHFDQYARALNHQGIILSDIHNYEEALQVSREALEIWQRLFPHNPQAYYPALANIKHNLGVKYNLLKQHQEAIAATQEAVQYYRQLSRVNPDLYLHHLAGSLFNYGEHLMAADNALAAKLPFLESITIYTDLHNKSSTYFAHELALSYQDYGFCLNKLQCWEDAIPFSQKAIQLHQIEPIDTINGVKASVNLANSYYYSHNYADAHKQICLSFAALEQDIEQYTDLFGDCIKVYIATRVRMGLDPLNLDTLTQEFGAEFGAKIFIAAVPIYEQMISPIDL